MNSEPLKVIKAVIKIFYNNCHIEFDELLSIGYIGYTKALKNYDAEKAGTTEFGYLAAYIRNEINSFLKKELRAKGISLNDEVVGEDLDSPDDLLDKVELEQIKAAFKYLTEQERWVIISMYLDGNDRTQSEVAREIGLSRERIRQVHDSAISKLRRLSDWKYRGQ